MLVTHTCICCICTYHMAYEFWVCLGTFVFVGSGHVVSMFLIVIKLIILITLVTKLFFLKIIHIEPLTNTINTILWCIWVYLGVFECIWVYLGKKSRPFADILYGLLMHVFCYLYQDTQKLWSHLYVWMDICCGTFGDNFRIFL
jgi:hypothetical protein